MSRLSNLYNAIETLRSEGVATDDLEEKVSLAEEEIIKNEILPILKQRIEPALQEVQRQLVLVVDYKPGEPISVALSRTVKIGEIADARPITPRTAEQQKVGRPVTSGEKSAVQPKGHEPSKQVRNPTKGLRVTFEDGTAICQATAIETFKAALRRIGLERVHRLGITHNGCNLVSREKLPPKPDRIFQHEVDGWFIYSNISNHDKARDLQRIAQALRLDLVIEEGKPEKR